MGEYETNCARRSLYHALMSTAMAAELLPREKTRACMKALGDYVCARDVSEKRLALIRVKGVLEI